MKCLWFLLAAGLPLQASAIDVSGETTLTLHAGDELFFQLDFRDYLQNAPRYGAPPLPGAFSFLFVSMPSDSPAEFQAGLESLNGSTIVPFAGIVSLAPGLFDGPTYSGPVSTLSSYQALSYAQSMGVVGPQAGLLYLTDFEGDVTFSFPGYTLQQDMYSSAIGGPISVGVITTGVSLLRNDPPVPEPENWYLVVGGGVAIYLAAKFLRRH
jgi:hypothetical protein